MENLWLENIAWNNIESGGVGKAHYCIDISELEIKSKHVTLARFFYRKSILSFGKIYCVSCGENFLKQEDIITLLHTNRRYTEHSFHKKIVLGSQKYSVSLTEKTDNVFADLFNKKDSEKLILRQIISGCLE